MMKHKQLWMILAVCVVLLLLSSACTVPSSPEDGSEDAAEEPAETQPPAADEDVPAPPTSDQPAPARDPESLLYPEDLIYEGAFRLPTDAPDEIGWAWGGGALTAYPSGDPDGPDDGYPGSLFGSGHDWNTYLSEIAIPQPVISPAKTLDDLNTATTLQPFADVREGLVGYLEIPRVGLEYLPPQGDQSEGMLYFAFAQHMGETETNPTHGWAGLDLSEPDAAGLWRIGNIVNYVTGDYLFAIPPGWADLYTPGLHLATGRFRDGGQGAQGPSIYAIAPWLEGNPPASDSTLPTVPLLLYGSVYEEEGSPTMTDYHHADEWNGAAWLTAGERAAVIFAGNKGIGECWYGCSDGTVWEPPYPEGCPDDDRGWWSTAFEAQIIFYDPADLAAVAIGEMESWEPQPYAVMSLDDVLYHVRPGDQQKSRLGAAAFDRDHGLLYVLELFGDEDRPLVHVWRVGP